MTGEVIIRKAVAKGVSLIVDLWKELMDFHKELDRHFSRSESGHEGFVDFITGHVTGDTSCVLVAEANKEIVGYCLAAISKCPPVLEIQEYGHVHNLLVTRKFRHRGVGKKLFQETENWFSEKGIHRIEVPVSASNKLAREFWAKMEFTPYLETVFLEI